MEGAEDISAKNKELALLLERKNQEIIELQVQLELLASKAPDAMVTSQLMDASIRSSLMNCMWCLRYFVTRKCTIAFHKWHRNTSSKGFSNGIAKGLSSSSMKSAVALPSDMSHGRKQNPLTMDAPSTLSPDIDYNQRRQMIVDYARQVLSGYRLVDGIFPSKPTDNNYSQISLTSSASPSRFGLGPQRINDSLAGELDSVGSAGINALPRRHPVPLVADNNVGSTRGRRAPGIDTVTSEYNVQPGRPVRRTRSVSPASNTTRRSVGSDRQASIGSNGSATGDNGSRTTRPRAASAGRAGTMSIIEDRSSVKRDEFPAPNLNGTAKFAVPRKDNQPHHLSSTAASISHQYNFIPAPLYFDSYHPMGPKTSGNSFCLQLPPNGADLSLSGVSAISRHSKKYSGESPDRTVRNIMMTSPPLEGSNAEGPYSPIHKQRIKHSRSPHRVDSRSLSYAETLPAIPPSDRRPDATDTTVTSSAPSQRYQNDKTIDQLFAPVATSQFWKQQRRRSLKQHEEYKQAQQQHEHVHHPVEREYDDFYHEQQRYVLEHGTIGVTAQNGNPHPPHVSDHYFQFQQLHNQHIKHQQQQQQQANALFGLENQYHQPEIHSHPDQGSSSTRRGSVPHFMQPTESYYVHTHTHPLVPSSPMHLDVHRRRVSRQSQQAFFPAERLDEDQEGELEAEVASRLLTNPQVPPSVFAFPMTGGLSR